MEKESQYPITKMKYQFWKRKLFPLWYKQHNSWEDSNMIEQLPFLALKSENLSINESTSDTTVSKQNFIDGKEMLYTTAIIIVILITMVIIGVLMFVKRRNYKHHDEEQACSILVYPSQQGSSVPQLLTKDINFSLPHLRSTSLGDLNETEYNDDSDYDTDTLLLPSNHNQRSHSFSCYGLGVIEPALYKGNLNFEDLQWPEGHIGRLWFSLRYEPSTEKLLVSLLKAKNLPSRTIGTVNSCDPFIRIHLLPDERRYLQSKQKKKTCNPYFDETLVFQVSIKDMTDHILKLTVVDGGRTKRKSEIGHITFPLKNLEVGDGTEQQLFKFDLEKELHELKSDLGEILISLVYNEHLNRLTATVIEGRRLKFQGEKHEAYVRVTLNQHYRGIKEKRTSVAKPSIDGNHSFAEGFNFKLIPSQADITSLAFHVFQHTAGYGRDKLIGKCVLGSYMFARGKALTHWNTAVANPMEPLQQWHTLNYTIPQRVIVIISLFLTMVAMYGTRTCLIFTIDKIVISTIDPSIENDVCKQTLNESTLQKDVFSWSYADQKSILTAFLPGYLITHIPGGLLADNLGGKNVLFIGLLVSGIISIVTPIVISNDNYFNFVVLRFTMGLAQGPTYPCVFSILSNWIQRSERGLFGSLLFISGPAGSVLSNIIAIAALKYFNWKSLYYLWGSLTLFWSIIYIFFCFTDPFYHPRISSEELTFLEQNIDKKEVLPLPWKQFFKSSATWAFLCGYISFEILDTLYTLLIPEYFYNVIKYDQNSQVRLIPTLLYSLSSIICGVVFDKLFVLNKLPLIKIRRFMAVLGTILPSICLIGIPLVKCDKISTYYLYLFGMLFLGPANCGIRLNVLDISRNFVGFTLGVVSCIGNVVNIFFPKLIDFSLEENIFYKWQSITIFASFNVFILSSLYCFTMKMERQEWDKA